MGRPRNYDRSKVLEKAMRLFWDKGFEGTHLQELVEKTGLNRFGLYKEFNGKDGLFEQAIELYLGRLERQVTPLTRQPQGLDNIIDYFRDLDIGFFRFGCFMTNTLTEKNTVPKKAYDNLLSFGSRFEGLIAQNLEAALTGGALPEDTDLEALSKFLTSLDLGMMVYSINAPDSDKDRIAKVAVEFLESMRL